MNPGAIGFVHIWDLNIHGYKSGPDITHATWEPTNAVTAHYAPVYDRIFSFDVLGTMWANHMYEDKSTLTVDGHHPSNTTYLVMMDLLYLSVLDLWIHYLDMGAPVEVRSGSRDEHAEAVRAHPMLTHPRENLFMPDPRMNAFSLLEWNWDQTTYPGYPRFTTYPTPMRKGDLVSNLAGQPCEQYVIDTPHRIAAILGRVNLTGAILINGATVAANVIVDPMDPLSFNFGWVHKFAADEPQPRDVRVCCTRYWHITILEEF